MKLNIWWEGDAEAILSMPVVPLRDIQSWMLNGQVNKSGNDAEYLYVAGCYDV